MKDYKNFTNAELENELKELEDNYNNAQKITLENYQLMISLAEDYGKAKEILDIRYGKKKEG